MTFMSQALRVSAHLEVGRKELVDAKRLARRYQLHEVVERLEFALDAVDAARDKLGVAVS